MKKQNTIKQEEDEETLQSLSVNRILMDMIEESRNKGGDETVLLMVVDANTVKIISSCLKMSDILGTGIISIEKLELKRATLPNFQAIYFVSPTKESIDRIVADYSNESAPQYNKLHVFFSSFCPQELLEELVTPSILKRMITCKQFNMSYMLKDVNLFDIGLKNSLQIFPAKDVQLAKTRLISTTTDRLLTVLANLKEKPYIQYQKNSWLCKSLAEELNEKSENLYKDKVFNDNRGIILIMDRTIDKSTPFLYDFSYISVVDDVLKLKDYTVTVTKDGVEKKHALDNNDFIWSRFKYDHIVPTIKTIQTELESFAKSDTSKAMKSNMDSTNEMSKAIKGMKEYSTKSAIFSYHINLANNFQTNLVEMKLPDIIDIQQEIVTGLDKDWNKVKPRDTLKQIGMIIKDFPEEVLTRIIPLIPINMEMSEQNLKMIVDNKLPESTFKAIVNLKWLNVNFSGINSSNTERELAISDEKIEQIKSEKLNYKDLRSESKIANYFELATEMKIPKNEFCFIEDPDKNLFKKNKKSNEEIPYFIVFVYGGITYSEVAAIQKRIKKSGINHFKVIIGGTSVFTSKEYLNNLAALPQNKNETFEISGLNTIE